MARDTLTPRLKERERTSTGTAPHLPGVVRRAVCGTGKGSRHRPSHDGLQEEKRCDRPDRGSHRRLPSVHGLCSATVCSRAASIMRPRSRPSVREAGSCARAVRPARASADEDRQLTGCRRLGSIEDPETLSANLGEARPKSSAGRDLTKLAGASSSRRSAKRSATVDEPSHARLATIAARAVGPIAVTSRPLESESATQRSPAFRTRTVALTATRSATSWKRGEPSLEEGRVPSNAFITTDRRRGQ